MFQDFLANLLGAADLDTFNCVNEFGQVKLYCQGKETANKNYEMPVSMLLTRIKAKKGWLLPESTETRLRWIRTAMKWAVENRIPLDYEIIMVENYLEGIDF